MNNKTEKFKKIFHPSVVTVDTGILIFTRVSHSGVINECFKALNEIYVALTFMTCVNEPRVLCRYCLYVQASQSLRIKTFFYFNNMLLT